MGRYHTVSRFSISFPRPDGAFLRGVDGMRNLRYFLPGVIFFFVLMFIFFIAWNTPSLTSQACEVDSTRKPLKYNDPAVQYWIAHDSARAFDNQTPEPRRVIVFMLPDDTGYCPPIPIIDTTIDTVIIDWELRMVEVNNCEDYPNEICVITLMGCPPSNPDCNYCMNHRETIGKAFPVYDIKYTLDTIGYRLTAEQLRRLR